MKKVLTGTLALALLATTAATAFAQDEGGRGSWKHDGGGEGRRARPGAMVNRWPEAQPQTQPSGEERRGRGDGRRGGGEWRTRDGQGQGGGAQAPAPEVYAPPPAATPQWTGGQGQGARRGGGWDGRRDAAPAPVPPAYRAPPEASPQWNGDQRRHAEGGRRWDGPRNGGQGWQGERRPDWNGARQGFDHRRWEQDRPRYDRRAYPPVYRTQHRYRGPVYQPPYGFYARSWGFGDYLPRGWYAQEYRILDWWEYDLPIPPVGYDWVRIGDDAVLIDSYNGRVVQVVYDLFW